MSSAPQPFPPDPEKPPGESLLPEGILEVVPEPEAQAAAPQFNPYQSPSMATSLRSRPPRLEEETTLVEKLRRRTGGELIYLAVACSVLVFFLPLTFILHYIALFLLYRVWASGSRPTPFQWVVAALTALWCLVNIPIYFYIWLRVLLHFFWGI